MFPNAAVGTEYSIDNQLWIVVDEDNAKCRAKTATSNFTLPTRFRFDDRLKPLRKNLLPGQRLLGTRILLSIRP